MAIRRGFRSIASSVAANVEPLEHVTPVRHVCLSGGHRFEAAEHGVNRDNRTSGSNGFTLRLSV
jgi:hypothetical protein